METMFLPKKLYDESIKYDNISLEYIFRYRPELIEVEFEYYLDQEDYDYLISLILKAHKLNVTSEEDVNIHLDEFFTDLFDIDLDDFEKKLGDYISKYNYGRFSKEIREEMLKHCENKARADFEKAFEYWVSDEDDLANYYETEEI